MRVRDIGSLFYQTYLEWTEDMAPRLSAALAFYTIFSLAPVLMILVAIAGLVFGQDAAAGRLTGVMSEYVGQQSAEALQGIVAASAQKESSLWTTIIGVVTILIGATGVFAELQSSLNTIWEVTPRPDRGYLGLLKDRFSSFLMILGIGVVMLLSVAASTVISLLSEWFGDALPGGKAVWQGGNIAASLAILALAFALLFKYVPDVEITWGDVAVGALFTAVLFTIGKALIGWYLGSSSIASTYGAAGSVILFIVWIYYSALILFFGAEFTQVYANRFGSKVVAEPDAVPVTEEQRAQQGMPRREGIARAAQRSTSAEQEAKQAPPPKPQPHPGATPTEK
ncbi:MAG TPA: YihY/virulence factor BrkB family protein [Planctomycetota bacterium]|nr:YihY/virulence factor BrkB family protein [Planctomycetota bacterium]